MLARYYADPERNIAYFSGLLASKNYVFRQAAQYGLALSYFGNQQYELAFEIIDELVKQEPRNLFYLDTYTDLSIEMNNHQQAIDKLSRQIVHTPYNQVLTLNLANVLIKDNQAERATALLKDYLLINPDHFLAYELLSDGYLATGQKLEMHRAKAEIYALVAAYPRAIDELQTAYNFANDRQIEKQRIRARIDQFRTAQEKLQTL
ncbi:tetratricopeptide repeat protein [Paraglaciecola aquimarina]|uniref:Tetratricopeptide repeat protein n=1 Tax=Paraglaciecola aquimarina TaxID=1235557 RepID=A0ABU3SY85_9ALTE|nr:tetratricopeptide repeat protein [Paraglaciecola aquimarina]MDU0354965.1 tetratricopeptide repeat protein [Paraglaciecola aquimarina]